MTLYTDERLWSETGHPTEPPPSRHPWLFYLIVAWIVVGMVLMKYGVGR